MPTTAERRALWFLAAALALGAGVRAAQAHRAARAAAAPAVAALDSQLAAVDSARLLQGRRRRPMRGEMPTSPVVGALPNGKGVAAPGAAAGAGAVGAMPPAQRYLAPPPAAATMIDADRASARELEALPGIGPALAARIVADRERLGPFGSIAGLARVKGIGPGLVAKLASRLRFSGEARATPPGAGRKPAARRRSNRVSGHALGAEHALDITLPRREL